MGGRGSSSKTSLLSSIFAPQHFEDAVAAEDCWLSPDEVIIFIWFIIPTACGPRGEGVELLRQSLMAHFVTTIWKELAHCKEWKPIS